MGNLFSKKESLKDQLINLENDVTKTEYELNELNLSSSFYSTLWTAAFLIPIISYFSYLLEIYLSSCFIFIGLFLAFYYLGHGFVLNKRKIWKKAKLEILREKRKSVVEKCKNDVNFSITKNLLEKYENEETRNTFFDQVLKRKKSHIESVSEFVLGSDPTRMHALICTKCGIHNGLVDPSNDDFNYYFCYSCKHKNVRKDNLETAKAGGSPKLLASPHQR